MRLRKAGPQRHGGPELAGCALPIELVSKGNAKIEMDLRVRGLFLECRLEGPISLAPFSFRAQGDAQQVIRFGQIGLRRERQSQFSDPVRIVPSPEVLGGGSDRS